MIDMENIILIGMPSSGKSTAGVLLAKRIGYDFIDCDLVIQKETGRLLPELIATYGADGFLQIEEQICSRITAERTVIATGGSAVYGPLTMKHLKSIGKVVFLQLGAEEVERRIPDLVQRGVLMRGKIRTVQELYDEREPLYERYADVTVNCEHKNPEELVCAIAKAVGMKL